MIHLPCHLTGFELVSEGKIQLTIQLDGRPTSEDRDTLMDWHLGQELTCCLTADKHEATLAYKGTKNEHNLTPAQELRQLLWRKWNASTIEDSREAFEAFYQRHMRRIIENAEHNL